MIKLGVMANDVIRSFFKKPATQKYPAERREAPERLRGRLYWNPAGCTGCSLCTRECPSDAIELITIDKASKRFVMRYHIDRCTFCAQCVQNCRFKCLELVNDQWELASLDKADFEVYYGNPADIALVPEPADGAQDQAAGE